MMKRRLFSILLALCMTLAMLPAAAFAGESSYDSDITIKHSGWKFTGDETVCYYIPTTNGKFSVNQPNSDSYLKVTKTGENEITITVHGNVNISVNKRDTIKSIKNLIITGATGKDTLSLSTTTRGTAISVLGDLTVTGIALTATADNGPALRANNITVSDATLIATNNSADSAAIQAMQGDGPLGNLTVSGTSAITVTNKNANGRAIHATIINGNETPRQTDASQVTISSPAPHSHVCSDGWTSDATGHWHRCADANCTEKLNFAAHSGGTATCSAKKKCEVCSQSYGELNPSNHTDLSDWTSDETDHWKACSACNTDIEKSAHTGGTATCTGAKKCEICNQSYGELNPSNHTALSDWIFDETGHWKTCKAPAPQRKSAPSVANHMASLIPVTTPPFPTGHRMRPVIGKPVQTVKQPTLIRPSMPTATGSSIKSQPSPKREPNAESAAFATTKKRPPSIPSPAHMRAALLGNRPEMECIM